MGANAQTSVPAFTTGQVLTAQQQTEINTGVPVFATTVTRDAAFGGTGEKALAQGQLAYIEATNVVQYYNGTAWATLAPAADSGLTLISSTTIGSAVSSIAITGAFSATYDNYRILVSVNSASTDGGLGVQLGATTTGYYRFAVFGDFGNTTVTGINSSNTANYLSGASYGSDGGHGIIDILNPFASNQTGFTSFTTRYNTSGIALFSGGYVNNTTSYTDVTFLASAGNVTGGTIKIYGYNN